MINIHDIADVIRLHDSIIEQFGGLPGVQDEKLLAASLSRPFTGLSNGTEFFKSIEAKAAVLLQSLIKFHPFIDGNKRTGAAITQIYLLENGYRWQFSQTEIVDFCVSVAASELNLDEITDWIKLRVRKSE
jgi:death-on-curing protein